MSEVFKATVKLTDAQVANIIRERFNIPATATVSFVVECHESQSMSDMRFTHAVFEYDLPTDTAVKQLKYPTGVRGRTLTFGDR